MDLIDRLADEGAHESVRASLDHCVKCTICESFCPFSAATPLFPGPKFVGPQAERFRDPTGSSPDISLDYCSGCGICTQVCPQGVKIAEINARARGRLWAERGVPLRNRLIARPSLSGRLATPFAGPVNWALGNPYVRNLVERIGGVHRHAPLPRFAGRTFRAWARKHRSPVAPKTIVYFHGCSTNYFEPSLGAMAVAVLEHNGYRVIIPRQDCCGLPLQSNGSFDAARTYVRRLAASLAPYARRGHDIVATSTSCSLMLKREALEILDVDDPDLAIVSAHTYDICEYLVLLHERGELATDLEPLEATVPYHAPCQQRGHGIGKPAMELFALIPGLNAVDLDIDCCGIAGTYGLKKEKYDISMAVGDQLFKEVRTAGSEVAACDSETCRWQITHGSGVPAVHPIELLYRSYNLSG